MLVRVYLPRKSQQVHVYSGSIKYRYLLIGRLPLNRGMISWVVLIPGLMRSLARLIYIFRTKLVEPQVSELFS